MQNDRKISVDFRHRLRTTRRVFEGHNPLLGGLLDDGQESPRVMLFFDRGLADAQPALIADANRWFGEMLVGCETVPGGERCKNDPRLYLSVARRVAEAGLDRQSYVVVVGGGAVLDLVGFAAATVHRGIRLVRICSTTLSQADSGVGVKNGINLDGVKNMLGAFAVPWAVINDTDMLTTLDARNWRSGFSEAVKVALIKDRKLFERIERDAGAIASRDLRAAEPIIERSAELHLDHIAAGGDPFELGSARPLDMGHWSAHKLEATTGFELLHGEAVAIGLAVDTVYSARLGLIARDAARRTIACLEALGFDLAHPALDDTAAMLEGLEQFREHLGGPLTLILPAGIGATATVHDVDQQLMIDAIRRVADGARSAV